MLAILTNGLTMLALLFQTSAAAPELPCHLKTKIAVGCAGNADDAAENAADLFALYKNDPEKILRPETQAYLNRFNCFRVNEMKTPLTMLLVNKRGIAEPDGIVDVFWINAGTSPNQRLVWIAAPSFDRQCPIDRGLRPLISAPSPN